jgi:hypothetical protein
MEVGVGVGMVVEVVGCWLELELELGHRMGRLEQGLGQ